MSQAFPLILAQMVQLAYNIVDRIYIGHMPGENASVALTGIGLCFPIITMISAFVNLVSTGSAPLCSMARGKGEVKKAQDILNNAYALQIIISISLIILINLTKKPLLYVLGASDVTYGYAVSYLNIYIFGTMFFALGTGMNTFINLQGYPRMGMCTIVIGAVMNLILDPIFIFVMGMGVKGAATATIISQFCSAAWVSQFLFSAKRELRLIPKEIGLKKYILKDVLVLGIPGFIMGATNTAVQSVCNATLHMHGGDIYVGIMTIINSVREIAGLPINGITSGSQPVISYNYGARKYDRVKQGIRFTAFVAISYTALFWVTTLTFPHMLLQIFTDEARVVNTGLMPIRVYFMGFLFMSLQFCGQSSFVAMGKAKQAIFFSIFRKIIIVVPLTILLPMVHDLGVMGVFLAEPISNFVGGNASFWTMYFTVYKKLGKERKNDGTA
ncbi:MAG: MATE family efflux transporter [Lachnospiraceae bacterium]|nr:MATE family efflux transporter [Lachnospiraceae bacterium]